MEGLMQLGLNDQRLLTAAEGWPELGDYLQANEELNNISPHLRAHPDVMKLRWQICAKESNWDACLDIARTLTQLEPDGASGWIHFACSARRASKGGLQTAREILLLVVEKFPKDSAIPYNLACYRCQLGNLEAAPQWLAKAFKIAGKKDIRQKALDDHDLKPLWKDIPEI
jgi:hypothetical protein